jgi:hypothetical protein
MLDGGQNQVNVGVGGQFQARDRAIETKFAEICAPRLTRMPEGRYRICMAQSILVFDFGTNEEAAQQARHKVDAWVQGFRLGKKILIRFEREEAPEGAEKSEVEPETAKHSDDKKKHAGAKKKQRSGKEKHAAKIEKVGAGGRVRVLVRLDFSDHEKLTLHRWLDRIPAEQPFKSAKGEVIRHSDPAFLKAAELFDSLESRSLPVR